MQEEIMTEAREEEAKEKQKEEVKTATEAMITIQWKEEGNHHHGGD